MSWLTAKKHSVAMMFAFALLNGVFAVMTFTGGSWPWLGFFNIAAGIYCLWIWNRIRR